MAPVKTREPENQKLSETSMFSDSTVFPTQDPSSQPDPGSSAGGLYQSVSEQLPQELETWPWFLILPDLEQSCKVLLR